MSRITFEDKCIAFRKLILTDEFYSLCSETQSSSEYADKHALITDTPIFPELESKGLTYIRKIKENDEFRNTFKYKRNPTYENQNYLELLDLLKICFEPSKIYYTARIVQETENDYVISYRTTVDIMEDEKHYEEIVFLFSGNQPLWKDKIFLNSLINIGKSVLNIEINEEELNFNIFQEMAKQIKIARY
jgi:hypothetical protein